jgi:hypothetical protein
VEACEKPFCGFPRSGGRVLCVHGSGSFHRLFTVAPRARLVGPSPTRAPRSSRPPRVATDDRRNAVRLCRVWAVSRRRDAGRRGRCLGASRRGSSVRRITRSRYRMSICPSIASAISTVLRAGGCPLCRSRQPIVVAHLCLLKTPYALRRLRIRAFFDSLHSCRPSSSPCSTRSGSRSAHAPRCTWRSSRSDTSRRRCDVCRSMC